MLTAYNSHSNLPLTQTGPRLVERILTSPTGERFRVIFCIALVDGRFKAQVVSAHPIDESVSRSSHPASSVAVPVACLAAISAVAEGNTEYISPYTPVVSPFTALLFYTSQPTRAPSLR